MNHLPGRLSKIVLFGDSIDKRKEMLQYVISIFKIIAKWNDAQLVLPVLKPIVSVWGRGKVMCV